MKRFTSKTQQIGELGEKICTRFLVHNGFKIKERNYTEKHGEIDIIAKKDNITHFIEVKSLRAKKVSYETYNPAENLTKKKFQKIQKTIISYLAKEGVSCENYQIDLYLVYIDIEMKKHKIKRIENITEI